MEEYLDVTIPLRPGIAVYRSDSEPIFEQVLSLKQGDPCNTTKFCISSHTGTHVDAPSHFFQNGKTIDKISPEILIGPAKVIQIRNQQSISRKTLEKLDINNVQRLLVKTDHSFARDRYSRFRTDYTHFEPDACSYLIDKGVSLLGIDSFSVDKFGNESYICHKVLLGASIVIVEMIDLKDVEPGDYEMICLPLRIQNCDGAPARMLLKKSIL